MNKLIFCLTLFFGLSAFATSKLETRVLEAIIKNADSFVVLSENFDGSIVHRDKPVAGLIATALLQNYSTLGSRGGLLSAVTISCDEKTNEEDMVIGGGVYSCELTFTQGAFKKKNTTLKGPNGEGQIHVTFEVIVPNSARYEVSFLSKTVEMEVGE